MKLEFLIVCDYAALMAGKLCIVGTFDRYNQPGVPTPPLLVSVAARLRGELGDVRGGERKFAFRLKTPAGVEVARTEGTLRLAESTLERAGDGGIEATTASLAFLWTVVFGQFGRHEVVFELDGRELGSTPVFVMQGA